MTENDAPIKEKTARLVAQVVTAVVAIALSVGAAFLTIKTEIRDRITQEQVETFGNMLWCPKIDCASITERVVSTDRMLTKLQDDVTEIKTDMREVRNALVEIVKRK